MDLRVYEIGFIERVSGFRCLIGLREFWLVGLVGFWVGRFGGKAFGYRNRWALVRFGFNNNNIIYIIIITDLINNNNNNNRFNK